MARNFNGSDHYFTIADGYLADYPFTVSVWFRDDSGAADDHEILEIYETTNATIRVSLDNSGDFACFVRDGGGAVYEGDGTLSDSNWHHGIWKGASTTDRTAVFDGGAGSNYTASEPMPGALADMDIGREAVNSDFWDGDIAEIAIWDVDLTDAEVAMLAAGYSALFVRPQNLVGYLPMLEPSGPVRDIITGLTASENGTGAIAAAAHPAIIYPERRLWVPAAASGALTASGTPSIEGPTASGTVNIIKKATGAATMAAVVASGVATQTYKPSGTPSIESPVASGVATIIKRASGTPSIDAVTASGVANLLVIKSASGTPSIDAATASGIVNNFSGPEGMPTLEVITASGVATLGSLTASGTPAIEVPIAVGVATQTYKPSGTPSIEALTASGVAQLADLAASGTPSIETLTSSGSVTQVYKPSGTPVIEVIAASGVAESTGVRPATASPSIDVITASGVATGPAAGVDVGSAFDEVGDIEEKIRVRMRREEEELIIQACIVILQDQD